MFETRSAILKPKRYYFDTDLVLQEVKPLATVVRRAAVLSDYADYVKIIRDLREDADKTQQEIADVLHTSQTMYARYERGANEMPIHHLLTLCEYYNVSADYILGRK